MVVAALLLLVGSAAAGGLEGPFVLWGPRDLDLLRRPALQPLRQDELLRLYAPPRALVLFARSAPARAQLAALPRLRTLLAAVPALYAPQDFLDVHPDYVNNETQLIAVQGPDSEQDAEITEKFQRLEDVYGKGNVLAILGNSCPEDPPIDEDSDNAANYDAKPPDRQRRQVTEDTKEGPALYHDLGKTLLYAPEYPILRYEYPSNSSDGEEFKLNKPVMVTGDSRGMLSKLIVTFMTDNEKRKVTLRFRFTETAAGYWSVGPVEFSDPKYDLLVLNPPKIDEFLGAPKGFSFTCADTFVFSNESAQVTVSLIFRDFQVQALMEKATKFGSAYDCVGFTTVPIWSGILVTLMIVACLSAALYMISEIKTMDRFENSKGKTLTITTYE